MRNPVCPFDKLMIALHLQADLLAVITAPGAAQRPVHELFEFHRPKQVQRSQASSVLKLSSVQHDIMYALAGCWDVCSTLSKVNDQVRHQSCVMHGFDCRLSLQIQQPKLSRENMPCLREGRFFYIIQILQHGCCRPPTLFQVRNALVSLYGIEKPAIITWFKNRRLVPKPLAASASPTQSHAGPRAFAAGSGASASAGLANGLPGGHPSSVRSEPLQHPAQLGSQLPRPPALVMQGHPQQLQLLQQHELQHQQLLHEQHQQRLLLQQQQEQQQQLQLQLQRQLLQQQHQQRLLQQQQQSEPQQTVPSLFQQQMPAPAIMQAANQPPNRAPTFSPIWSLDQSVAPASLDLSSAGARGGLALQHPQLSIPWQSKESNAGVLDLAAAVRSDNQGSPTNRQGYPAGHGHIDSQQPSVMNSESQQAGLDVPMTFSTAYRPPYSSAPNGQQAATVLNISSGSSGFLSMLPSGSGSGSGNSLMGIADVPASWAVPGGAQLPQFQQTAVMWDTLQWEGQPISLKYLPQGMGEAAANAGNAQQPLSPFAWAGPHLPSSDSHPMYKVIGQIVGVVNNNPPNSNNNM